MNELYAPQEAGPSSAGERLIVKRRRTVKACDRCRSVRSRCQRIEHNSNRCTRCTRLSAECTTTQPSRSLSIPTTTASIHENLHESSSYNNNTSTEIPKRSSIPIPPSFNDTSTSNLETPIHHSISLSAHLATEPRILGFTSLSSLRDEIAVSYGQRGHEDQRKGDERDVIPGRGGGIRREIKLSERELSLSVIEQLLSDFATHISPLNPILLSHEIFSPSRMSVITISSVCAVASLSRTVPTSVFLAAKNRLVDLLDQSDVLKVASVANIQASRAPLYSIPEEKREMKLTRCSSAVRMAQELGLHRADIDFPPDINMRRRSAWRSCLIADRWLAAGYGLPQIIDLDDCDDVSGGMETDPQMILQQELYSVSTLLGRVLKEIYTPKILARTNDDRIEGLIMAIDHCRSHVHEILRFTPTSEVGSVVFELSILTVEALFLRGVTSTKIRRPPHVTYRPSPGRWKGISERAQKLVQWIEEKGDWLLDTSRIGLYGLTFCSLMMFRDHTQTHSPTALQGLQLASKATTRWAEGNSEMTYMTRGRKNHAQIIKTLYVVARDGVVGRSADTTAGERIHVVSPLAEGKNKSTTYTTHPSPPTSPGSIPIALPASIPTELEVGQSLLKLTEPRRPVMIQSEQEQSDVPSVGSEPFPLFGLGVDANTEEMAWSMPAMDNWLSEILEGEASGAGWTF
uniref:Zn(2)-C6 fungal-type domain-containing protein n=1 Tax=Kwoniella bestiolae CBS 10118 TaxID=1296100 RepID=A0A1B9G5G9_9TREE|nr:hypothetical protein I302_03959 [Kwoniella bestiolae CBS 10118]OCF26277.1 hypothetical protein I302_03959 [Kwoniella bestiolae CBS 10118]